MLFHVPSVVGFTKQGIQVDTEDIDVARDVIGVDTHPVYKDQDVHDLQGRI